MDQIIVAVQNPVSKYQLGILLWSKYRAKKNFPPFHKKLFVLYNKSFFMRL